MNKGSGGGDVIDPTEFRAAMERLGIKSSTSRNKAFNIFEQLKSEIIIQQQQREREETENLSSTMQLLMNEGYTVGPYKCVGFCGQNKQNQGVCLSNCKHCICQNDFKQLISNVINSKSLLQCPQCIAVKIFLCFSETMLFVP